MSDMYEKICPLLVFSGSNPKCRGSQCAFANIKRKAITTSSGKIQFENDGWYCLVRDLLISMASGE